MEVLTAYVREHAPWPLKAPKDTAPQQDNPSSRGDPAAAQGQPPPKLATDIQAVLTVLGRRNRTYERGDQRLDLSGTNLQGAKLRQAHLEKAILTGAHLEEADLQQAYLQGAEFDDAHLEGAYLPAAHLEWVWFWFTHLEGANLAKAHLQGAEFRRAHLEKAILEGAHLERAKLIDTYLQGARGLTVEQLCTTSILFQVRLDLPLAEQTRQQCPKLVEAPLREEYIKLNKPWDPRLAEP
jgi:hypothetical protein